MAQVLKEEIAEKIYVSAKEEFFEHGYKGATMRNIAVGADIPVGLVYSYYANKKELFDKVVQPVYLVFQGLLSEGEHEKSEEGPREDSNLFDELGHLLDLFKNSREDFLIMIDKSEGTKYENIKSELIEMTELHIKAGLMTKVKEENKDLDDLFFHILANNFMESIFEIGRHYKNEVWAREMLNQVAKQYFYGVNSF